MQPCRESRAALTRNGFVEAFATLFLVALAGTSYAEETRDKQPDPVRPASLTFTVIRSDNGRPVVAANIGVWMNGNQRNRNQKIVTNADAVATIEYPDGSASSVYRFPPQTYPGGLNCIDGAAWLTLYQRDADAPAGMNQGKREIQCFGRDGTLADSLPIPAVEITVSPQTGTIWVSDGEQILKIDRDGKTLLSIPLDGKSLGVRLGTF